MTNFIEFTIKNLDLRTEKATQALEGTKFRLKYAIRDNNKAEILEYSERIENLQNNIVGYAKAKLKLQSNSIVTSEDAKYIIKGLDIRSKRLKENLEMCQNAINREQKALITKQDTVMDIGGGLGVSIKHYDDVSIKIIEECEQRVEKITKSLGHCEVATKFFKNYL